jgi:GGDEF domain-containing protein
MAKKPLDVLAQASNFKGEENIVRLEAENIFYNDMTPDEADALAERLKAAAAKARKNEHVNLVESLRAGYDEKTAKTFHQTAF